MRCIAAASCAKELAARAPAGWLGQACAGRRYNATDSKDVAKCDDRRYEFPVALQVDAKPRADGAQTHLRYLMARLFCATEKSRIKGVAA